MPRRAARIAVKSSGGEEDAPDTLKSPAASTDRRTAADRRRPRHAGAGGEIARAKKRFGLAGGAPVHSGYEAGRDGFRLHRFLECRDIVNLVVVSSVDASSFGFPGLTWHAPSGDIIESRNERDIR